MNYFTEQSIEFATQRDYLDQLFRVYPFSPDNIRKVSEVIWKEIEESFNNRDNVALFKALLKLKLFPIKDSYVPFFRKYPEAINHNPQTINRICGRVRQLGLDKLYEKITEPKETNRQTGPLFRQWLESGALGVFPCDEKEFLSNNENAILKGNDSDLKNFAYDHLDFKREDEKGLDLIGRFNGKYIVGEAKFITDEGGHKNDQFLDAMTTLKTPTRNDVTTIAILDGLLYIPSKKKMYKSITSKNVNVMSALLVRDFLYSL